MQKRHPEPVRAPKRGVDRGCRRKGHTGQVKNKKAPKGLCLNIPHCACSMYGAGKESRTLDLNLGKVALYQLSYSRICC